MKSGISYTVYAKQQPLPLVGDEHYPDGCVGITFPHMPSATFAEVRSVVKQLNMVLSEMARGEQT